MLNALGRAALQRLWITDLERSVMGSVATGGENLAVFAEIGGVFGHF